MSTDKSKVCSGEGYAATDEAPLLCPSAQPSSVGSFAYAVVDETAEKPHLTPLMEPLPVTDELLAFSYPFEPIDFFRFAAPCAKNACPNFDGSNCRLSGAVVQSLPEVTEVLPACHIRSSCRWFQQEGKAVCMRCPQVLAPNTETDHSKMFLT